MNSDPAYNINVSGDIKHMLADLGTEKAKEIALHGGGGNKARNERAAAIAAILESRSKIKEDSKADEAKPKQTYSVVDAASASVHGRSAAAAKAGSSDKTAARIAMHMAGDRAPVNSKMVSFLSGINSVLSFVCVVKMFGFFFQVKSRYSSGAASRSFTSTAFTPVTENDFELIKVEKNPKKKGYVQFLTTHGDLNIELHCDIAPRACENFITLCERGYYNGVTFHRSIRYIYVLEIFFGFRDLMGLLSI